MSRITSLLPTSFLGGGNSHRDRTTDGLTRLRFTLETLPGSKKYIFTPATRLEILSELYETFWGPHGHRFLPSGINIASLPMRPPLPPLLSEIQTHYAFHGAGVEEPIVPGRSCGHIFLKGESCYRCKDCALDDSCVMCARCFHATKHENHNVTFYIAQQSGGCCDCGDREAWRQPTGCRFHPPGDPPALSTDPTTPKAAHLTLDAQNTPPLYSPESSIPPDLLDSMSRTIAYALDLILDTLDFSPDEASVPATEEILVSQPSADPLRKDLYAVIVWNDEKHSFDEVIRHVSDTCDCTVEEAANHASKIDEHGRDIVEMNNYSPRLLEIAQAIAKIDLGVTVRRAYDTFREQVAAVLIEWLLDLTKSRIDSDTLTMREVIATELLSPRRKDVHTLLQNAECARVLQEIRNPDRLDWLFLYHTRLWKKPRLSLKEIYVSVLTLSSEYKIAVAVHFANVYHWVIDSYLLVDREAETSIKYFALQLFTVPSVAAHIVQEHDIITRLLAIIRSFFTNQIVNKRVVYPPDLRLEVDVDTFPFRSKRFMPVFSDLRYIAHNKSVQKLIAHDRSYIEIFAETCMLFMCVNPNKRAAANHVEYETDAWISVFNVTLSLSRVIKVYGEAFAHATPPELLAAIYVVVRRIIDVCDTQKLPFYDRPRFPIMTFHNATVDSKTVTTVDFDIMDGWVSFHHSLHWLLAELLKHIDLLNDEAMQLQRYNSIRDAIKAAVPENGVLMLIDFPLRVLAMIAQIRTGLWVRNGFVIRGQLLHYRDFMLRELCYDQDLFIIQSAFILLDDPDVALISIMDRFQLLDWFNGSFLSTVYEGSHLYSMVEEILYVFITVLSENANASRMSLRTAVRREIVHALAVGACPYTDLVKRIAERMVDDVCFDHVLRDVSNFRPPESTADSGIYELKDECYDEVNPFFYHYTRNKREEVESILKNRLKKKTGVADPVIVPRPIGITSGPFQILSTVFDSSILLCVMFHSINNILFYTNASGKPPPSTEAILDQSLHLVMLGLVERVWQFAHLASSKTFEGQKTLIDVLCDLEVHTAFRMCKSRVEWILSQFERYVPLEVQTRRRIIVKPGGQDPDAAKKRAAKARQEAIMKQMKAQQSSFAMNFEDDFDDNDEDKDMMDDGAQPISFGTCIVCQESLNASKGFGALGLIQPSRLIRKYPEGQTVFLHEALLAPTNMDRPPSTHQDITFPPKDAEAKDALKRMSSSSFDGFPAHCTKFGLYSSVCTHMMHLDCFQVYNASIKHRHRAQGQRNHPESVARKEYICPLCKSLGNVVLPVLMPATSSLNNMPFSDWVRSMGITILKSKPDHQLDASQSKTGTGEFVFWAAQDAGYIPYAKAEGSDNSDWHKMLDTLFVVAKSFSQQTRHLRERPEPELNERGAGLYLPEDLIGYTLSAMEVAHRGTGEPSGLLVDRIPEHTMRMVRGLVANLTRLASLYFRNRLDGGRDAIRQAIIKRLLPEWSRTSLTSLPYPLLLREPLTILVETAAVAPEMLRNALIPLYYVCLARTVIGLVYVLNKCRASNTLFISTRQFEDLFGDVRSFCMSVVRQSPVIEHTAEIVFDAFGEGRIEKLLYTFTLPFLRRASILCRAMLPSQFPTPDFGPNNELSEYSRLLKMLGIPPLSELPRHDTLKNLLFGWCSHYGQSHTASQLNCGVTLEHSIVYRTAELPLVLDTLFGEEEKLMVCRRCKTVPVDAAICLICGTICCMQSHCCKDADTRERGECNLHMRECGGAVGVYFLVKRCSLLYLFAGNGSFVQAPYLDVHGEIDISMRRGRRQYLHHARWEEVRKTWLNHGIPTLVARKLESTIDSGGWETL